jgi:ADP-ribose pyrophosphatase YjhB (NUDIX family)
MLEELINFPTLSLCYNVSLEPVKLSSRLANEEHVDAAVRELHDECGLILTLDDLTLLSDAHVQVALPLGQQLVYVYSASVHVPCVTTHLRTPDELEQAVTAQSTINLDGSYVVPETIDISGLNFTPAKKGLLHAMKHKSELLDFGYVTQWETIRRAVYTSHALFHDDTTIPRQFFIYPRFSLVDSGHVWLLIRGYVNQVCGEIPTDLRVGMPIPTTNLVGLLVTLTETKRKATANLPFQYGADARDLEDWFEAQPRRFLLLGITADSYDSVIWFTSQFSGHMNGWWLNRKVEAAIPSTFDLLVAELRKTTFLPNIQDGAIKAMLNFTQGGMSYALYTQRFNNDFLRRSRQKLTANVQCVRFINGMANFELKTQAKSHRSQRGYNVQLVELQNFLNDVVADSPYLGGMRSTADPSTSHGRGQATRKRNYEDPLV